MYIVQNHFTFEIRNLVIFGGCAAWFVSDLVNNLKDRFSHNEAHLILTFIYCDFHNCKNGNFQVNIVNIFPTFAQNIDWGYTLEPLFQVPTIYF